MTAPRGLLTLGQSLKRLITTLCRFGMPLLLLGQPICAQGIKDNDDLLPIALKCPWGNKGILELISGDPSGFERQRITYVDREVTKVEVAFAVKETSFLVVWEFDFVKNWKRVQGVSSPFDGKDREQVTLIGTERALNEGCKGTPAQRQTYRDLLRANAEKLNFK